MKHTKRILAIMLAALFLVAMVPTAFAADKELTITCDKDEFEFTFAPAKSIKIVGVVCELRNSRVFSP